MFLVSCGYRPGLGDAQYCRSSITVPYVCGDRDGTFTAELIRELVGSGAYRYQDCSGDLILKARIMDRTDESIGFRYETDQFGNVGKRLVASEDRAVLIAEISLVDGKTLSNLLGPVCIRAAVDYDFAPETSAEAFGFPLPTQTITRFSLGQLDFREAAAETVRTPLYRQLAKEIVDYISESW